MKVTRAALTAVLAVALYAAPLPGHAQQARSRRSSTQRRM